MDLSNAAYGGAGGARIGVGGEEDDADEDDGGVQVAGGEDGLHTHCSLYLCCSGIYTWGVPSTGGAP